MYRKMTLCENKKAVGVNRTKLYRSSSVLEDFLYMFS